MADFTIRPTTLYALNGWDSAPDNVLNDDSDSTYGYVSTNSTGQYQVEYLISDVPADFDVALTIHATMRGAWQSTPNNSTWPGGCSYVIFGSDTTSVLANSSTDSGAVGTSSTPSDYTESTNGIKSAGFTAPRSMWVGGRVRILISRDRVKGGDSLQQRVHELTLTGTYTPVSNDKSGSFAVSHASSVAVQGRKGASGSAAVSHASSVTVAGNAAIGSLSYVSYYNGADVGGLTNPSLAVAGVSWSPGDLIVVYITWREFEASVNTLTDDGPGETYTYLGGGQDVQNTIWAAVYTAIATGTGSSATITLTTLEDTWAAGGGIQMEVEVVSGTSPRVDVFNQTNTGATDTDSPTTSVVTTEPGLRFVYFQHRNRTFTITPSDPAADNPIRENTYAGSSGGVSSISSYWVNEVSAGSKVHDGTLDSAIDWIGTVLNIYEDVGLDKSGSFSIPHTSAVTIQAAKARSAAVSVSHASAVTVQGEKNASGAITASHASAVTASGTVGYEAAVTVSHASAASVQAAKGGEGISSVSHASAASVQGRRDATGTAAAAHASSVTVQAEKGAASTISVSHASATAATGSAAESHSGTASVSHASTVSVLGVRGSSGEITATAASATQVDATKDSAEAITVSLVHSVSVLGVHEGSATISLAHTSATAATGSAAEAHAGSWTVDHASATAGTGEKGVEGSVSVAHGSATAAQGTPGMDGAVSAAATSTVSVQGVSGRAGTVSVPHASATAVTGVASEGRVGTFAITHVSAASVLGTHAGSSSISLDHVSTVSITGSAAEAHAGSAAVVHASDVAVQGEKGSASPVSWPLASSVSVVGEVDRFGFLVLALGTSLDVLGDHAGATAAVLSLTSAVAVSGYQEAIPGLPRIQTGDGGVLGTTIVDGARMTVGVRDG